MQARSSELPNRSAAVAQTGRWAKLGAVIVREFKEVIPPTVFFFVGFNLILFTKRLMLSEYLIAYTGFLVATTGALIVGKVVLIADKMPILRRFDYAPLAYPIVQLWIGVLFLIYVTAHGLNECSGTADSSASCSGGALLP
jgi:hypothetical protein